MNKHFHQRNYPKCEKCCCGQVYYHDYCGGKWHEKLVDDTVEDGFIHNYRCDKCNEKDYRIGYEEYEIEFKD